MNLDDKLQDVSVVGAAGKMGSGISLLLAQEMALLAIKNPGKSYALHLLDIHGPSLSGLWHYLRHQATSAGEKQIVLLKDLFKGRGDLAENGEIVQEYVYTLLSIVRPATEIECARHSSLVFEAAIENAPLKIELFQKLRQLCGPDTYFFTNTSSIPLDYLQEKSGLQGRILGLHFYNPPAVQKLLEIIPARNSQPPMEECAAELVKRMRKTPVYARDIAGFIGNGHFIREGVYAFGEVRRLEKEHGRTQAIYLVNKVTQDFLLRPMGIFQLIDYVGIDVFRCIQKVMTEHLAGENLLDGLIDEMVAAKVLGGQRSDGSQKDGFFKYEKNRPAGVHDMRTGSYVPIQGDFGKKLDAVLGATPEQYSWKTLSSDPGRDAKLEAFFAAMKGMDTVGANLARSYLNRSRQIAQQLVADGVAKSAEDVNTVLKTGFFHLYGPIQNYL